jgi:hypothetical protein
MNRREFIAGLGGAVSVGHAARPFTPGNGVPVANHMAHSPDADEGYDYDYLEHDR